MTDEQKKQTAAGCVHQAATRPMDSARKRQFAIVRTQSALKVSLAEATDLVDDAIADANDAAGRTVIPPAEPITGDTPGVVDSAAVALLESNSMLSSAAEQIEELKRENAELREQNADLTALLASATAPVPEFAPPAQPLPGELPAPAPLP